MLLPSHEDRVLLGHVVDVHRSSAGLLEIRPECVELAPVVQVRLLAGAPVLVLGEEVVLRADDFALEIGRERGVILGQA